MARVITVTLNPCLDRTIELSGFNAGGVNRAENTMLDAGGKGINVSRALKGFGVENIALGIVGGESGKTLERKLEAEGVDFEFTEVCGETRTNYKIYDKAGRETTDINEPGITLGEESIFRFRELYKKHLRGAEYAVLSGSIPPGVPPGIYRELAEMARLEGVKVILDTSGEGLREGIKAKPYAIKPNICELEELLKRPLKTTDEILAAIGELTGMGVELAAVSMGEDGAVFAAAGRAYRAGILKVEAKSTVGCGDSVVAGLVYSSINGFDLKKTAMFSAAAGGVTAGKEGTKMCRLDEVKKHCGDIEIREIK